MSVEQPSDIMRNKLNQARAMLLIITGTNALEDLHSADQDYYLSTIFNLVDEAVEVSKEV